MLLCGPGFGKTAIVARLCKTRPAAVHLCRHNDERKRDPRRMLCTLAHQLACALPDYRAALEAKGEALGRDAATLQLTALVDELLVQPLAKLAAPRGGRRLLVIDALDEADRGQKENDLLRLVRTEFAKLPTWLAVLLTSRPEVPIKEALRTLQPEELDAADHADACEHDVRVFLREVLASVVPATTLASVVDTVAKKAERNFLYLYWLRKSIDAGTFDVTALPEGLGGHYQEQLQRLGLPTTLDGELGQVLRAILAAAEPLHIKDELPSLSGVAKCKELVKKLSQLFPVRDERVHTFHKSIADWLSGSLPYDDRDDEDDYYVDRVAGHRSLAATCADAEPRGAYATRWALHHCAEVGDWARFTRLATDLDHLDARFAAGSGAALALELGRHAVAAPFQRLVLREMPVLLREPGALLQLAAQQPDDSAVFVAWQARPRGVHVRWRNKPQALDACLLTIGCGEEVRGVAQLEGERYAVATGESVEVRDARNGELLETLCAGGSKVQCVAASKGAICAGFEDGTLKVWDAGACWPPNLPSLANADHS